MCLGVGQWLQVRGVATIAVRSGLEALVTRALVGVAV